MAPPRRRLVLRRRQFSVLNELAASKDPRGRRSAIAAPLWFIKIVPNADAARGLAIADVLSADGRHECANIFE